MILSVASIPPTTLLLLCNRKVELFFYEPKSLLLFPRPAAAVLAPVPSTPPTTAALAPVPAPSAPPTPSAPPPAPCPPLLPAQLPVVVGSDRSTDWSTARIDAPCQHSSDDERLWHSNDRRQAAGARQRGSDGAETGCEPPEYGRGRGREAGTCGYRGLKWVWEVRLAARNQLKRFGCGGWI